MGVLVQLHRSVKGDRKNSILFDLFGDRCQFTDAVNITKDTEIRVGIDLNDSPSGVVPMVPMYCVSTPLNNTNSPPTTYRSGL